MGTGRLVGATASLAAVLTAAASGMTPAQASVDAPRMTRSATAPLTNLAHLDFLGDPVAPPAAGGPHDVPARRAPADRRRCGPTPTARTDGSYRARRRRHLRPGDEHLRPGRLQRRRHGPRRRRLPARTGGRPGTRRSRARGLRAAARPDLPADRDRARTPATSCCGCSPTAPCTRAPTRRSCPTRPTAARPTGWPARSGRSARATRPSAARDPAFARFLQARLDLGGRRARPRGARPLRPATSTIDGRRTPAWLVVDGADASRRGRARSRGLRPGRRHRRRPGTRAARSSATASPSMSGGDARAWPFGGVLPWALSRSDWHAWSSQMPAALAGAADVLGDRSPGTRGGARLVHLRPVAADLRRPGQRPAADPHRRQPDRLRRRLAGAVAARRPGRRPGDRLAGVVAAWFFGANASGAPTYDPATGVTFDGVAADGTVNHNSGAESTIHGLLTMLALDAHPGVARDRADRDHPRAGRGTSTVAGGGRATLTGGAHAVDAGVAVDRGVAVRRHRLRRRCATAARATFDARRAPGRRC